MDTAHWVVEIGKNHGKYKIVSRSVSFNQSVRVFDCYNVHSGGKKRMRFVHPDGTGYVKYRVVNDTFWENRN